MANVSSKFEAKVQTSKINGEWVSWIARADLPIEVEQYLQKRFPGIGPAWNIRMDAWTTPDGSPLIDVRHHCMVINDATMPCLVSGNVDYSAWDD